ncbi:lysine-sensitive aspartokinase 3 [Bacteriovorax stolpii]|uniref:Aspartokinase n=1 Tax=Bacteriovorax stolpii TaxID=960 RepID=A0A2K9NTB7_BACTC|nr:lysine-sensitive aspartokinase 3 [Bacteriovorax stolpii]AUN98325.1 lysine-sensitive aspartokinase 3 [Bacteriovorax stolpii]QDK41695.1 lysine-sensitive aspartokinase 3 [Bacteriovorax stolpii]TDP52249.1 aspartate kinase [Bacteriovorax stolpii]
MKLVVSKFGGTSMGDAGCMLRSASVSLKQGSKMVVVSATSGTTNDLIELARTAEKSSWDKASLIITKIKNKHEKIARDLELPESEFKIMNEMLGELESMSRGIHLLKDCSLKAMDSMQSFGERLSSILFTHAMNLVLKKANSDHKASWLDVRDVLVTDNQFGKARPQTNEIIKACDKRLGAIRHENMVYVTQGFIGQTLDGMTTTLGRGGSDYSAAILAEGIKADILEIWTDVAGIATTDPRICPEARAISEISFKEASELATFGAKILHPATLMPAIRSQIPVFVGSSFEMGAGGTWIKKEVEDAPLIRAMALRRKQVLVTLSTPEMLYTHGFLYQIFKVFNDHKVSIDAITTSEISVSMTLDDSALLNKDLIRDLEELAVVQVEEDLSLVSLIGNNINHTPGLAKKIFNAIDGINVRMICLGASKHNFCFIVDGSAGEEAIKKLHKTFIEG